MKKLLLLTVVCLLWLAAACSADTLTDYLAKAEPAFQYSEVSRSSASGYDSYELSMTSLTYKETQWKHRISIIVPKTITIPDTAVMAAVMGDDLAALEKVSGLAASMIGCPVVVVWNVPNRTPGLSDDAAIAKTISEACSGGASEDILLLPMAKSVLKAMDACDGFFPSIGTSISKYVVGGPSKDGWITWLAAASGDKRIAGIIPIIYDFLNIEKQLKLQTESYGRYSDLIKDYTPFKDLLTSTANKDILRLIDPITYAPAIKIPKLLINATNDSYWNISSANIYWKDLQQPKYLLYAVNMDHGKALGGKEIDPLAYLPLINSVGVFIEKCAGVSDMPAPTWSWTVKNGIARCTVKAPAGAAITAGTAFVAASDTSDLRQAEFKPVPMTIINKQAAISIKADKGYKAAVCQIALTCNNKPYVLFTTPQVVTAAK